MLNKLKKQIEKMRLYFVKLDSEDKRIMGLGMSLIFGLYTTASMFIIPYMGLPLFIAVETLGIFVATYLYFIMLTSNHYFINKAKESLKNNKTKDKINFGLLFYHLHNKEFNHSIMEKFIADNVSTVLIYSLKKNYITSNHTVIHYDINYSNEVKDTWGNLYDRINQAKEVDNYVKEIKDCTTQFNLDNYNELLRWYDINAQDERFNVFNKLEVNHNLSFIKEKIDFLNKFNILHSDATPEEKELFNLCTDIKEFLINNAISYINETDQQDMNELINKINDNSINYLNDKVGNDIYTARELVKNNNLIKERKKESIFVKEEN